VSDSKVSFSVYYLAGVLFIIFGFYQIYLNEPEESILYISLGGAFLTMGLLQNNMFPEHRHILNIISWSLIIIAILGFLYVLTILPATRGAR
jgi:hypothetical protein